ncbi:MAG TPA: peptidase M13, partial [Pseudomonadaceae bacterium]|nr:peptidase M13 [Pseudomonadaceae bacterium]
MYKKIALCSFLAALLGCGAEDPDVVETQKRAEAQDLGSGIELVWFDQSVAPGDDFYRYVNGTWLANTSIPADKSNYGVFTMLDDEARDQLRSLVEEAAAEAAAVGSDSQKVGDFYNSFMDTQQLQTLGAEPIQALLEQVSAVDDRPALLRLSAELNRVGVQIPAAIYVNNDERQSDRYITYITQSGLGLPDRDWYLSRDDSTHAAAREAYRTYISRLLMLAGYARSAEAADSVVAVEQGLAAAHWDRVKNRQAELTYNKMQLDELIAAAPGL